MNKSTRLLLIIFLSLYPIHWAQANNSQHKETIPEYSQLLNETMGVSVTLENNVLNVTMAQKKALDYIVPRIEAVGIWPGINSNSLTKAPTITTSLIAMYVTVMILKHVYEDTNVNEIMVNTYIQDDSLKHLIFSYEFSRDIYNSMDVDNTNAMNFSNVAHNFKYSDWYTENAGKETTSIYQTEHS